VPKASINGTEIYYLQEGEGPRTFLLFNGAGCEIGTWGETADQLADMGTVIRFDYRDVGRSATASESYTLETLASDAEALLDHLKVSQAVIAAHAFGGRVAQVFVRDFPERVEGLILCGTGGQFPPNLPTLDSDVSPSDRFFVTYCGSGFQDRHPQRAQRLFEDVSTQIRHPGAGKRRAEAIQATPSPSYWGKIPDTTPVLLLYGTDDRFGTPENADDLHQQLRNSHYVRFEGAGHFAMREEPDRVVAEIQSFVERKGL